MKSVYVSYTICTFYKNTRKKNQNYKMTACDLNFNCKGREGQTETITGTCVNSCSSRFIVITIQIFNKLSIVVLVEIVSYNVV